MPDILHNLIVAAEPSRVFEAVTLQEGLASWWTEQTTAQTGLGARLFFDFGERYHNAMTVVALESDRHVAWHVDEAHPEWVGTRITFDLEPLAEGVRLRFGHRSWREATDFYADCNFHWGQYMKSLKAYCERGAGSPWRAPDDGID